MHMTTRNVETAFDAFVELFRERDPRVVSRPSRAGPVMMIDEPVTITYERPRERVLVNPARDANPFFHLYEVLWMLAGRNDVAPLAHYNRRMRDYSDDGKTMNGAYGYRWRKTKTNVTGSGVDDGIVYDETDQLDVIINHLKTDPNSRRAVLQMWNVEDDLLKTNSVPRKRCERCKEFGHLNQYDEGRCDCYLSGKAASKDVCCNLSVLFLLRDEGPRKQGFQPSADVGGKFLDMTVTNRSNDLIWGTLGSDFVTFSVLQEYVAARVGAEVGRYHQFTNNLHVYEDNWKPETWLSKRLGWYEATTSPTLVSLVRSPSAFDEELPAFVEAYSGDGSSRDSRVVYGEPFLSTVAQPMMEAFRRHKARDYDAALAECRRIAADDWREACVGWVSRRNKRR